MADILIRGMEMPPSCADCPIKGDSDCKLTRQKVKYYHEDRRDDCPLVELPPHGDLIEKDLVLEYPTEWFYDDPYILLSDIKAAPVVIPAERSGE